MHRGANGGGAVREQGHFHRLRKGLANLWQQGFYTIGHLNHIGTGLALNIENHGRGIVFPSG